MYPGHEKTLLFLVALIAFAAPVHADVSWSESTGGPLDTLAPRIAPLTPAAGQLYLGLDDIYFSWQITESNPGIAGPANQAEIWLDDQFVASAPFAPDSTFADWTWTAPDGAPKTGYLLVRAIDAFGNSASVQGERFTLLPSTSGISEGTPRAMKLAPVYPNPFNPRATIRFSLPAAGPVEVCVYDLRGRQVRSLRRGALAAGEHDLVWDGTGDDGRRVPGGAYIVRLVSAHEILTRKAVLLP